MHAVRNIDPKALSVFAEHIPDNLLLDPVEYMFADHCRQADVCGVLVDFIDHIHDDPPALDVAASLVRCLEVDWSYHIADEEMDLFPRLRIRIKPEDQYPKLMLLLDREHERDRQLTEDVCGELKRYAEGKPFKDEQRFVSLAAMLASSHLSHLEWENMILLPLARKRLTGEDLKAMSRTMAARRSVALPVG